MNKLKLHLKDGNARVWREIVNIAPMYLLLQNKLDQDSKSVLANLLSD